MVTSKNLCLIRSVIIYIILYRFTFAHRINPKSSSKHGTHFSGLLSSHFSPSLSFSCTHYSPHPPSAPNLKPCQVVWLAIPPDARAWHTALPFACTASARSIPHISAHLGDKHLFGFKMWADVINYNLTMLLLQSLICLEIATLHYLFWGVIPDSSILDVWNNRIIALPFMVHITVHLAYGMYSHLHICSSTRIPSYTLPTTSLIISVAEKLTKIILVSLVLALCNLVFVGRRTKCGRAMRRREARKSNQLYLKYMSQFTVSGYPRSTPLSPASL